jgi:hypothetical protein
MVLLIVGTTGNGLRPGCPVNDSAAGRHPVGLLSLAVMPKLLAKPPSSHKPSRRARLKVAAAAMVSGLLVGGLSAPTSAQVNRIIPTEALPGVFKPAIFPEAFMNGQPVRLGAGARIYDEQNMIRMPASLSGDYRVAFVRGNLGEIIQIWMLTEAEYQVVAERAAAARRSGGQR